MVLVLRLLSSAVNGHELLKLTHTADSTLMKYASQAFNRCRETALPCPLSLLCTYLKNAISLTVMVEFYSCSVGDRTSAASCNISLTGRLWESDNLGGPDLRRNHLYR